MTRFCLVRHGETPWNREGRYQGQSDVPLSEVGRSQARLLARELQGQPITAIYSSDLERASKTADIIAETLALHVVLEPRLREIDQGQWEGRLVRAIRSSYSQLWNEREVEPAQFRPPGGETVAEVADRVYAALDDMTKLERRDVILVVSHGLALATVICRVRGISLGRAYDCIPENAAPVWVNWAGAD